MIPPELITRLKKELGAKNIRQGSLDLAAHSYDASPFIYRPEAVAWPASAAEAALAVKLAAQYKTPLTVRGAGTSLSGGAVPRKGGLVLSTTRMNKIIDLDLLEETVLVETGRVNLELQNYLADFGYMFPPDPASQKVATLGGNIAENAGGIRGVKYGITKHYVLGLELVLPDGEVVTTGALAKGAGPDLSGIFIASEGTFALITKALLKITPLPVEISTASALFDNLENAGQAVADVLSAGIIPTAMEIIDHELLMALEDYLHLGFPPETEALLLIEVDGLGPELENQMKAIAEICLKAGAGEVRQASDAAERNKLWLARRSGNGALGRLKPANICQDVAVPVDRLPEMLATVQRLAKKHNVQIAQLCHAGDGNLHPHLLYDPADKAEYERVMAASHDIFAEALAAGGTITGEHGIGLEKKAFMASQFNNEELAFMGRIKKAFDPQGRMNYGKILPDEYQPGQRPQEGAQ